MPRFTTLTEFVEEQLTKFDIPDTEKNHNKLRIKFTRTLKDLGIWDEAETKLIGRKHTKVFTHLQLQQLYNKVEPYLLKHSKIDLEELETYRRGHSEYLEKLHSMSHDEFMKYQEEMQYEPPKVTNKEAMQIMLTALFEKFFEPLDLQQWNKDKALTFFTDDMDADSVEYFLAKNRLDNPITSYVKPRKH
ncbi:hypothetical protein ACTGWM_09930 [Streptococcus suis]